MPGRWAEKKRETGHAAHQGERALASEPRHLADAMQTQVLMHMQTYTHMRTRALTYTLKPAGSRFLLDLPSQCRQTRVKRVVVF